MNSKHAENRLVVLDTETTGFLEDDPGHRIIEIGCVELIGRRPTGNTFHCYFHPDRPIDPEALRVHGLTETFLADQPRFSERYEELMAFLDGAQLVIHNAPFDVAFLNAEMARLDNVPGAITDYCLVLDTLQMARELHPGQRNSLDALCRRYEVDNSSRDLHGALLDAQLLASVYLAMTGGQTSLFGNEGVDDAKPKAAPRPVTAPAALRVVRATESEQAAHRALLEAIDQSSDGACLWKALAT